MADALLAKSIEPLPPNESFIGAGIYAIYYIGDHPAYQSISAKNRDNQFLSPIYVGKAVPAGARKGGLGLDINPGTVLYKRLIEHAESIKFANNLDIEHFFCRDIEHFFCRYLVVDDIWIPLGESLLIDTFSSVWNKVIDGFGNHDPGSGRHSQQRSAWDVLHPGRPWANNLKPNRKSESQILGELSDFLARSS